MLIPAMQRLCFCVALGQLASPWQSLLSVALEPKLIERNLDLLSEESSSTPCCILRDLWLGALRQANLPSSRILAL